MLPHVTETILIKETDMETKKQHVIDKFKTDKQILETNRQMSDNSLYKTISRFVKATENYCRFGYQWSTTGKETHLRQTWIVFSMETPQERILPLREMCQLTKLSVKCTTLYAHQMDPTKIGNGKFQNSPNSDWYSNMQVSSDSGNDHLGPSWVWRLCYGLTVVLSELYTTWRGPWTQSILTYLKVQSSAQLYTISMDEMMKSSSICLLSKASKSKSWLWHRRLNHLNFGTINDLARKSWPQQNRQKFIRTDTETEFVNQVMFKYYEVVAISSKVCSENSLTKRKLLKDVNRTLVEADPDLTFFRVFGALCYPANDSENLGKFQAKADIGIFVGYAPSRKGYRIYNKRTRRLMETIHVTFDEMHQSMAPVRISSGPEPIMMTHGQLKTGLAPTDKELEICPTEEPIQEDTPIIHDGLHPSHNLVTGDPGSTQSSSGNVNAAEPNQV
ncbi:integrase, catalytic region, zinc finger, CCHC-type containing protein [Tanacetum coccineum]